MKRTEVTPDFVYLEDLTKTQAAKMGATWSTKTRRWRLPNTLGVLRELIALDYEELKPILSQREAKRAHMQAIKKRGIAEVMDTLDPRLREYQKKDVAYLSCVPHAGIFNQQRTGKTPTALALCSFHKEYSRILVVCPASLVRNWEREISTWVPEASVIRLQGDKRKRTKHTSGLANTSSEAPVYAVISYESLRSDWREIMGVLEEGAFIMIVDEAHRLKNVRSQQSKAVYQVAKKAGKRLALTGTPAQNAGEDIFGILRFLYPQKYPSQYHFLDRYFRQWQTPWGKREVSGTKRRSELMEILDLIAVQRKRSDVMAWLPKVERMTVEVDLLPKQAKLYEEMATMFTAESEGLDAPGVLAQLTRLRQLCVGPEMLGIDAPSAKEQFLMDWLSDNPEESVIIFSNFSSYLELLHKKVKGSALYTGKTTPAQRTKIVNDFQKGKKRVLFANIKAAGTGLTLDTGSYAIFLDRDFVPANNEQAEDRIIATAKDRNMQAVIMDISCPGTVDGKILRLLEKKVNVTKIVNDFQRIRDLVGK